MQQRKEGTCAGFGPVTLAYLSRLASFRSALCAILAMVAAQAASAHAFTIERAESRYVGTHYEFELVAILDAPPERVEAVLRDYANYTALDARILEARVLERPAQYAAVLATTVRACLGPFCRNVKRVERVEESPLELKAVTDPARSDVTFGETHTMLSVTEGRTRVSYRTAITPSFWVPAIAGRRWMLNTLSDATIELFKNVELRAKVSPAETSKHATK
jgi:hypothetical protein